MAPFAGLIGGSYTGRAVAAAGNRSVNFFPERVEDPTSEFEWILLSKPGLMQFASLAGASSVQAMTEINGRCFAVASGSFFEIKSDGSSTNYGSVATGRAQIVASQSQVLILAGGLGYLFTLATNTLTQITDPDFPTNPTKATISDTYFLVLSGGTQQVAFSALSDGLTWDALDYLAATGEPGNIVSIIVDHRQLWLFATTHAEIYYDSGDATNPWTRLNGAFSEQGCGAVDSLVKVDNTIMWLGSNPNGGGIAWRMNGYTPQRISTHAVEAVWQTYPTYADASGYCYQEDGHAFYRLDFPSANAGLGATWVYDAASGFWHERTYFANGQEQADLSRSYAYAFGLHLTGDYQSGRIYAQSMSYYTDAGAPIRRWRSFPSRKNGGKYVWYTELRLMMQVGVGLDGGVNPGSDPQVVLKISNDGGFTWGNDRPKSCGAIGRFDVLVKWDQLGRSRNRAFGILITEPIPVALCGCDVDSHA